MTITNTSKITQFVSECGAEVLSEHTLNNTVMYNIKCRCGDICELSKSQIMGHMYRKSTVSCGCLSQRLTNKKIDHKLLNRAITRITDCNVPGFQPSCVHVDWSCNICGHTWAAVADSVLNKLSGCPKCSNNVKFTVQSLSELLKSEGRTISILKLFDGHIRQERKGQFACNICLHIWSATLSNVTLKKQGCPRCGKSGRYNANTIKQLQDTPGMLYVISCSNDTEQFLKIGITKRDIKNRYTNADFKYNIIDSVQYPMLLKDAWELEQHILKTHQLGRYIPTIAFGGRTECYVLAELPNIILTIQDKINEKLTNHPSILCNCSD